MPADGAPRSVRELPLAERPRMRLVARGAAGLSAAELIGLVWSSGSRTSTTTAVAQEALAGTGSLAALAASTPLELERVPGVGPARAAQLAAAFELGRRAVADWPPGRWTIRGPADLAQGLVAEMGHLEREELRVVLLDTRNGVLAKPTVYRGNVSVALVRVGELFRDAVRLHAARTILVHNHPSGDPAPSPDDLHLTAEAVAAGRLLDIAVLDHLVVGHGTWVSLRDRGVTFERS
ncbi:DNA repair protein RadC [soil metagenome]